MEDYPDRASTVVTSGIKNTKNVTLRRNKKTIEDYADSKNCSNKEEIKIVVKYAEEIKNNVQSPKWNSCDVQNYDSNNSKGDKFPPYPMNGSKPGVALVINNIKFDNNIDSEKLPERKGADIDKKNLKELFTQMRFEWIYWENQTKIQIMNIIKEFTAETNELLKEVDSCFVIIMSHGGQGDLPEDTHIYTSDCKKIKANDIISRFNSSCCSLLQDKPKFIIFQACRGDLQDLALNKQPANNITYQSTTMTETSCSFQNNIHNIAIETLSENDNQTVESENTATISSTIQTSTTIPSMSDVFIYYTTSPGFLSYRDTLKGTWFVQYFCEVFMNHVYNTDVRDLFGMITKKVTELRTKNHALQVPHYAIRGNFKPCFLYPALKTLDDNQATNQEKLMLEVAYDIYEKTENTKIAKGIKKINYLG